jgi:hypothetical protein
MLIDNPPPAGVDSGRDKSAQDELVTIAGGVEMEVTHQDGSKETVKVRQIPISKIQKFVVALGDEAGTIGLYCDKPSEWADTLSLDSASAVLDKGQELNLPFLSAWFRRQAKWRESQATGAIAELEAKIEAMIAASRSGNSARQSPTSTSSPQNK